MSDLPKVVHDILDYLKWHEKRASQERENLYTRVQGWNPNPQQVEQPFVSTSGVVERGQDLKPGNLSEDQIASKWGLMRNPDGGWVDSDTSMLFADLEVGIACKSFAKSRGIPLKDAILVITGSAQ